MTSTPPGPPPPGGSPNEPPSGAPQSSPFPFPYASQPTSLPDDRVPEDRVPAGGTGTGRADPNVVLERRPHPEPPPTTSSTVSRPPGGGRRWKWGLVAGTGALLLASGVGVLTTNRADEAQTLRHSVDRVTVRLGSADVQVVNGATSGSVEVNRKLRWGPLSSRPNPDESWSGNTLEINEPDCSGFTGCSIDYVVRVPSGITVDLRTGSGNIAVGGELGSVGLDAGSGNIDSNGVTTPELTASTGSGNINLDFDSAPAQVVAKAGSGNIGLDFQAVPKAVTVDTGSGNVDLAVPGTVPYAISGATGSGERVVKVPTDPGAPRVLNLTTGSGNVAVTGN